jgi:monofunctional glycosyltransferase
MDSPLAASEMRSQQDEPRDRPRAGRVRRFLRGLRRAIVLFFVISIALTALYRFVPPPLTPLMVIRLFEGEAISKDWVAYEEISPNLVRAVIAAEDASYCSHWGFDFAAIEKALKHNEKARRIRGGSTISNQTAKNTFLWPGDSKLTRYARKAIEPYFTLLIELLWGKKRIVEVYLNVAEWGHGLYGAEAAAQFHFKKSAAELTKREAALLAAVLPNPRRSAAGQPSAYIKRRGSTIQSFMADIPDASTGPCS